MTKENAIKRIERVADGKRGQFCYQVIMRALQNGYKFIRPAHYSGRGRFTTLNDYTWQVEALLNDAKILFTLTNDAAKGSATGNIITLTHIEGLENTYQY